MNNNIAKFHLPTSTEQICKRRRDSIQKERLTQLLEPHPLISSVYLGVISLRRVSLCWYKYQTDK